jgi:hypothetical protein
MTQLFIILNRTAMPLLATLWWPSLDPIGPASIFAVAIVCIAWVLAEIPALFRFRAPILIVSLVLFGSFLVVSAADLSAFEPLHLPIKYRRFPDLSDYLANYLFLAVGVIFGFKLRRLGDISRRVGRTVVIVFGTFILAEIFGLLRWGSAN